MNAPPPLWVRLIGCLGFVVVGVIFATHPSVFVSTRNSTGEIKVVGWAAVAVFGFAGVTQAVRAVRKKPST
jgi:hypothetical protein